MTPGAAPLPEPSEALLRGLVQRLADSEAALQTALHDQVDAIIDPGTATPILLRRAQQALRESEERFRVLVDGVKDHAIFMLDPLGNLIGWNAGAERITGYSTAEIVGQQFSCFYTAGDQAAGRPGRSLTVAAEEGRFEDEGWCLRRDTSQFWANVVISALRSDAGTLRGFAVVARDATERKALEEQLRHQALYDSLTGLPNRALFTDRLAHACVAAQRHHRGVAILFLDVDEFKLVNDSLGHVAGDEFLVALGRRLVENLRAGDSVARLGGDEFTVLLEEFTHPDDAVRAAARISIELHRPFTLSGRPRFVTVSGGLALSADAAGQNLPDQLMREADIALHDAKRSGKAQIKIFEPSMARFVEKRLDLETDLRWAVERKELRLHYQPLVNLATGTMDGMEALVRWEHPLRGLVQPTEFIPLAEENGLIIPIGRWVLEEACRQACAWQATSPAGRPQVMSLNLSARQLQAPDLVDNVDGALRASGLDPTSLRLEITESAVMRDAASSIATLNGLKKVGVQPAVDDFGTGYSSLGYLQRFPLDSIKVDQSFVGEMVHNAAAQTIVEAVIALAHALGLDVTAEGVETAEQLSRLRGLQCDHAQGFYFSRPVASEALDQFFDRTGAPW